MSEGSTITIPGAGPVKKQWVYIGGAVAVGIVGYAWWTRRGAASSTEEPTYVEPGYEDYGGGLQTGTPGTTTPGIGWTPQPPADPDDLPPTTNAVWVQRGVDYLQNLGFDAQLVATTLGKYLARVPVTGAEADIIRTVEGAIGKPPVGEFRIIMVGTPPPGTNPPSNPPPAQLPSPWHVSVPLNTDLNVWISGLNNDHPGLNLSWSKFVSMNDLNGQHRKYWRTVNGHPEFFKWHPTHGIPPLRIN